MWPLCDFSLVSALWLLGPLLLGLLTAFWIWGGGNAVSDDDISAEPQPLTAAPEPVSAPVPDIVPPAPQPVAEPAAPPPPPPPPTPVSVAPAAPAAVAPVAAASVTSIGIAAASGDPDNLRQIKGVGPKLNGLLISLGITRFDQIAAWDSSDVAKVDEHLGNFQGRIDRDHWIEQAGLLASGDIAAFETKFGKLDG